MPLSANCSPKREPHALYLNQNPTKIISFLKDKSSMNSGNIRRGLLLAPRTWSLNLKYEKSCKNKIWGIYFPAFSIILTSLPQLLDPLPLYGWTRYTLHSPKWCSAIILWLKCRNASGITCNCEVPIKLEGSRAGWLESLVTNAQCTTIETCSSPYWEVTKNGLA